MVLELHFRLDSGILQSHSNEERASAPVAETIATVS